MLIVEENKKRRIFFQNFFQEVEMGLRGSDKEVLNSLIEDLVEISQDVPPQHLNYTFREILMLMSLINQKN